MAVAAGEPLAPDAMTGAELAGERLAGTSCTSRACCARAGLRRRARRARSTPCAPLAASTSFRRDELYWALHAVLVQRREDHDLFDQAFRLFWRDPLAAPRARSSLLLPQMQRAAPRRTRLAPRRRGAGGPPGAPPRAARAEQPSSSTRVAHLLRRRGPAHARLRSDERRGARPRPRGSSASIDLACGPSAPAASRPGRTAAAVDLRPHRARRAADRRRRAPLALRAARRRERPPLVVALRHLRLDGPLLRDAAALRARAARRPRPRVHVFLFGTRLTNVTRALRHRDVDEALARCGREVADWAGGTRLGACLHEFNRAWSRRVLAPGRRGAAHHRRARPRRRRRPRRRGRAPAHAPAAG